MLDAVPLAGAWRQVCDNDRQPRLIGERWQLRFPSPHPHPVAAAASVTLRALKPKRRSSRPTKLLAGAEAALGQGTGQGTGHKRWLRLSHSNAGSDAAGKLVLAVAQLRKPTPDRAAGDAGYRRHRQSTTTPRSIGSTGGPQPPVAFSKERRERLDTGFDGGSVNHPARLGRVVN